MADPGQALQHHPLNHTAMSYRWYTITLHWLTGDTLLLCTNLQVYTITLHRPSVDTRLLCTDLQVSQGHIALTYKWNTITLQWLTSHTLLLCTDFTMTNKLFTISLTYRLYTISLTYRLYTISLTYSLHTISLTYRLYTISLTYSYTRSHWLTAIHDLTDLQVKHNHTALTYKWNTITLQWLTSHTLLLCTDLQVIHKYSALTYRRYIVTLH